jgi:ferredoxin/NAD-dependent dihydropyrimidine dehydrogenase PreA subunit
MPTIRIDNKAIDVPPGGTILDGARRLGIDVPTLCFLDGCTPSTSCLACMVKLRGEGRLAPSCATEAIDGMDVESESDEVHRVRRAALELLLSDHLGDCLAPCQRTCPAGMDIPLMLRQIADGRPTEAIVTVKRDIALPAVLGRVCPAPCEKGCRRAKADAAVAICELKRHVADVDLALENPYQPECRPASGKRVAILGAGPTGLAAAWHLARQGHAAMLLDDNAIAGGRLRTEFTPDDLPPAVLDAEIGLILRLGAELRPNTAVDDRTMFDDLRKRFDAVLVACGAAAKEQAGRWGLAVAERGVRVERRTYQTSQPGVFAAGGAIRGKCLVVRSVADGKEAAAAIDRFLMGRPLEAEHPFSVRIKHVTAAALATMLATASGASRREPDAGFGPWTSEEAAGEAARCLHCDCRDQEGCKLRRYAAAYRADAKRYGSADREFREVRAASGVVYEPGKCIDCGLCIQIAARSTDSLGLTFIGRGFDVRVGVPFDRSLDEALGELAAECVEACPTGALVGSRLFGVR